MQSSEGAAESIGSLCCQTTAGPKKCFEQIGTEKEQAELIEMVTRNRFMRERQAPWKQFTIAAKRPKEFPRVSIHL